MVYHHLECYAKFLLAHHLDELVTIIIQRAKQIHLPLLKLFAHFSEEQLFEYSKKSLKEFLESFIEGTFNEVHLKNIQRWKANQIPEISKTEVGALDLTLSPHIRKYSLIKLLRKYTQDLDVYENVIQDIEAFYSFILGDTLQAFVEVQHEKLEREKEFLQTIINHTEDGITAYDTNLHVTLWNRAVEQRIGVSAKEIVGKYIFEVLPGYEKSQVGGAMKKSLQGEIIRLRDMPYIGREGYYEADFIPLIDTRQKIVGVLAVSRDITERKMAARKLERNQAMMALAQSIAHVGSWEWDLVSGQVIWTDEMYRIYGYKPQSIKINYVWALDHFHPDDVAHTKAITEDLLHNPQHFDFSHRIIRSDKSIRFIHVKGGVTTDDKGKAIKMYGASQDVTEQKQLEKQLHDKNSELIQALEELRSAQDSLIEVNNELEQRVLKRTKELAASEEELRQTLEQTIDLNTQLLERENFLSSILDQTPISTWIADEEGTMVRVNEACLKLFGLEDASLGIGKYNILKDNTLIGKPFYNDIQAVFKQGKVARFEIEYNLSNVEHVHIPTGKLVSLVVTIFPIKDENEKVVSAVIQYENITERKAAVDALQKSEELVRLVTDALPVLISYIDATRHFQFVNKAYESWFNIPRSSINGKHLEEILGSTAYAVTKPYVDECLSGKEVYFESELDYQYAGRRFVSVNLIPHYVGASVMGYYALITDISETKQAQQALADALNETNRKNEELKRINIDLDNFVYTASHDLKAPIANLEGITNVLAKKLSGKLDNKEMELIDLIGGMTAKLRNTIKDLTEITKVQKESEEVTEIVTFEDILQDIRTEIDPMLEEAKASIRFNFEIGEVQFAKKNLRSILYNLTTNAIKYRSPERELQIYMQTYREGEYIVLSVQDNGLGIAAGQIHKLFSMFRRLHTHVEGTGIGLYITKRIVENNRGRIEVESREGEGSTFRVYFRRQLDYNLQENQV